MKRCLPLVEIEEKPVAYLIGSRQIIDTTPMIPLRPSSRC